MYRLKLDLSSNTVVLAVLAVLAVLVVLAVLAVLVVVGAPFLL